MDSLISACHGWHDVYHTIQHSYHILCILVTLELVAQSLHCCNLVLPHCYHQWSHTMLKWEANKMYMNGRQMDSHITIYISEHTGYWVTHINCWVVCHHMNHLPILLLPPAWLDQFLPYYQIQKGSLVSVTESSFDQLFCYKPQRY